MHGGRGKRIAFDPVHDEKRTSVIEVAEIMHADEGLMLQAAEKTKLGLHTSAQCRIAQVKYFHRDKPFVGVVPRAVHIAHAAASREGFKRTARDNRERCGRISHQDQTSFFASRIIRSCVACTGSLPLNRISYISRTIGISTACFCANP